MYISSGYLNNERQPIKDKSRPLMVTSCGMYQLHTRERLPTWRPRGRLDYQLLYVASGKTFFHFNEEVTEVSAGNMILFQPRQEQHYEYFGKDKPEVYWVHFTGSDVKNILKKYRVPLGNNVFYSGSSSTYTYLFKEMIHELQMCRESFDELLEMYLRQIFLLIRRSREDRNPSISSYIQEEMEYARRYFNEHYQEDINIEEYARSRGMSISWFMRNYRRVAGRSPKQYILNIRIKNAASLLETTDYSVMEIATIIGYDNPLYFSRLFRKQKGVSPTEYRKAYVEHLKTDNVI